MNTRERLLISILNWNGWEDTLACCRSLLACFDGSIDLLIVDNGSADNSVERIRAYLSACLGAGERLVDYGDVSTYHGANAEISLLVLPENIGFAKGCNRAAARADAQGYKYLMLLNNDTLVASDAPRLMRESLLQESADVVIPKIEYFDPPGHIWNCGGDIDCWGRVTYRYARMKSRDVAMAPRFRVSFVTGCCMLVRTEFFRRQGGFTERFFFGEEDVEFSLRMKASDRKLLCDSRALVLHKVGASLNGTPERDLRKTYIHLLNRLINMKDFMPRLLWFAWAGAVCVRFRLTASYGFDRTMAQALRLFAEACRSSGVDGSRFREILRDGI